MAADDVGRGGPRTRRRGVRASRVKLAAALANAGLKTQAALAERIAEREGLDSAPRGVVYRVFREQPVDVRTLARVAGALDVGLHELLLSGDEESIDRAAAMEPAASPPAAEDRPRRGRAIPIVAFALVLVVAVIASLREPTAPPETGPGAGSERSADLSTFTFAVLPLVGDAGGEGLVEALRARLSEQARVLAIPTASLTTGGDDAPAIAAHFGVEVLVDGRVMAAGRHAAVRLRAWRHGETRIFWVSHMRRRALEEDAGKLAPAALDALAVALAARDSSRRFPAVSAQEDYLRGRQYLDQSQTELNVRRALNHFEAALRGEEAYPAAHAGLCLALLQQSLINSEASILADARRACSRAEELDSELPVVRLALGQLARRTGEPDQARRHFEAILRRDPSHTDALLGLVDVALMEHREGDVTARERAVDLGRRAMASAPGFWKPPFSLARVHFFTGNLDEAIRLGEAAVQLDDNAFTLANLGTSHLCRGDHERAVAYYGQARALAPDASVGEEQMCVAYYFARRFDEAVEACRAAVRIDSAGGRPAHHEMWGNLADAYRQAGQNRNAADAYARAAVLAEKKLLVRGHSPNDRHIWFITT